MMANRQLKLTIRDLEKINSMRPSHAVDILQCTYDTIDLLFEQYILDNDICKRLTRAKEILHVVFDGVTNS